MECGAFPPLLFLRPPRKTNWNRQFQRQRRDGFHCGVRRFSAAFVFCDRHEKQKRRKSAALQNKNNEILIETNWLTATRTLCAADSHRYTGASPAVASGIHPFDFPISANYETRGRKGFFFLTARSRATTRRLTSPGPRLTVRHSPATEETNARSLGFTNENSPMKRRLFLLLTALAMVFTAGCNSAKSNAKYRIVVIPKGLTHEFWQSINRGAQQAGKDLQDRLGLAVDVKWDGPLEENQTQAQLSIIDRNLAAKVQGIMLAPQHSQALIPAVEKAVRQGVPVLVFDSGLAPEADQRDRQICGHRQLLWRPARWRASHQGFARRG